MRDEEKNNPRVLPIYKPWWVEENYLVDESWTVTNLRTEATKRGLHSKGTKEQLLNMLRESYSTYDLNNNGFRAPIYIMPEDGHTLPSCYPEMYEIGDDSKLLLAKAYGNLAAPSK